MYMSPSCLSPAITRTLKPSICHLHPLLSSTLPPHVQLTIVISSLLPRPSVSMLAPGPLCSTKPPEEPSKLAKTSHDTSPVKSTFLLSHFFLLSRHSITSMPKSKFMFLLHRSTAGHQMSQIPSYLCGLGPCSLLCSIFLHQAVYPESSNRP